MSKKGQRLLIILVLVLLTPRQVVEESSKIEEFLRKIKQSLERLKDLNRNKRKEDRAQREKRKKEVRKKLIERLSLPYTIPERHFIIDTSRAYANFSVASKIPEKTGENVNTAHSSLHSSIKNFLKENSLYLPFRPAPVKTILQEFKKYSANSFFERQNKSPENPEFNELYNWARQVQQWYRELAKKAMYLWLLIEDNFLNDPDGFDYFSSLICRGLKKEEFFDSSSCYPLNPDYMLPHIYLEKNAHLDTPGAFSPYCYKFYKDYFKIDYNSFFNLSESERVTSTTNVCRDFLILFSLGKKITDDESKLRNCIEYFLTHKQWLRYCEPSTIRKKLAKIYNNAKKWFRTFELVLTKKVVSSSKKLPFFNNEISLSSSGHILSLLLYYNVIDNKLQILEQIYQTIKYDREKGDILTHNNCEFTTLQNEKENFLETIIRVVSEKNVKRKEELINDIKNNTFSRVFGFLFSQYPEILARIIETFQFKSFITQLDKIKEEGLKKKDICSALLFGKIYWEWNARCSLSCDKKSEADREKCYQECESMNMEKNIEIVNSLVVNDMEWALIVTNPDIIEFPPFDNIEKIFESLPLLDYYIYKNIVLYRAKKCDKYQRYPGEPEKRLEEFHCIFKDTGLNTKCFFKDVPVISSIIEKNLGGSLPLVQIRQIFKKKKDEILPSLKEQLENYLKNNIFNAEQNLFECYLSFKNRYVEETSLKYFCGEKEGVKYIKQYCLTPLKKCEDVDLREPVPECNRRDELQAQYEQNNCEMNFESEFCQDLQKQIEDATEKCNARMATYRAQVCYNYNKTTGEYKLDKNASCNQDIACSGFHATLLGAWQNGCLCNSDSPPPKIIRETFCEYIGKLVEACCLGIKTLPPTRPDNKVAYFLQSFNMQFFDNPLKDIDEIMSSLRKKVGAYFFDILTHTIKDLPHLYSQYLENKLCK